MKIVIDFIPEADMRYDSLGDWFWDETDTLHIRSVDTGKPNEDFLVAWHELAEAWLCRDKGISQQTVDEFDLAFVTPAEDEDAEPGDDERAPYRAQHRQAMLLEMTLALFLGLDAYGTVR